MARILYDDDTKAAALVDLMAGSSVSAVAKKYGASRQTVRVWRDTTNVQPVVSQEKRVDLGERLFRYLDSGLAALEAQARVAADPAYIRAQPAGELAILHGVLADKLVRVLAALEPADQPE